MKYQILNQQFKTKKESLNYVRSLIYRLGKTKITPDHEEFNFFCALFKSVPDRFELIENPLNRSTIHINLILGLIK